MWFVIGLVWLAAIWAIFWVYRKKREKHASARAKQMEELFSQLKLNPKLAAGVAAGAGIPTAVAPGVSLPLSQFVKKQRVLPRVEALLYYVFRTGLPDHEIFVNLTLSDLVEIEPTARGHDREQKARRLAQARLNLVICTKQLEVVAVVIGKKTAPDVLDGINVRFIEECLHAAGIKLLAIDPAAPPRHQEVRALIYDVTTTPITPATACGAAAQAPQP